MGRSRTISDPGGTALPRCWMIKSLLLSFTQNEWQTSATGNARDARTRVNSDSGSGFIGTYARTASSQNRNTSYMSVGFGTKNWRENRHDAAGICQSRRIFEGVKCGDRAKLNRPSQRTLLGAYRRLCQIRGQREGRPGDGGRLQVRRRDAARGGSLGGARYRAAD